MLDGAEQIAPPLLLRRPHEMDRPLTSQVRMGRLQPDLGVGHDPRHLVVQIDALVRTACRSGLRHRRPSCRACGGPPGPAHHTPASACGLPAPCRPPPLPWRCSGRCQRERAPGTARRGSRRWRAGEPWHPAHGFFCSAARRTRYACLRGYRLCVSVAAGTASPPDCHAAAAGLPGICFLMGGRCVE